MASSAPLQLFPAPHSYKPSKSNLRNQRVDDGDGSTAPGELKGIAFQVSKPATQVPPHVVRPANDQIKHSLFCEPEPEHDASGRATSKRTIRTRRRLNEPTAVGSSATSTDEDRLSPLLEGGDCENVSPPDKFASPHLKRPTIPRNISVEAQADVDQPSTMKTDDQLSPLPGQERFVTSTPASPPHPTAFSVRSGSPTLVRSNSAATSHAPYSPPYVAPMRSIFPQYDHSRAPHDQQYYPSPQSSPPTLPSEKISKLGSPRSRADTLDTVDAFPTMVDRYEHIPAANSNDILAIWNASESQFPVSGRKVQLMLHQPRGEGTSLAVGLSEDRLLYSMRSISSPAQSDDCDTLKQIAIRKHFPKLLGSTLVSKVTLPAAAKSLKERQNQVCTIFPHMAAVAAIEAVSNSPAAAEIASFDPSAASPQAARLAQDAVSEAHARHRCYLSRSNRVRDSLGAVVAKYMLEHPTLGVFTITVTKSTAGGRHTRDPRAKISLHHPSATPAAIMAETLVLAFLDFARDSCVVDTPGLLALQGHFVIDTIMCALFAVAAIENDALMAETVTFEPPPKSAFPTPKHKSRSGSPESKGMFGRKKNTKKVAVVEDEHGDLPALTQGALAVLGLSFKTAVFLLETGVKATAGVVIGVSHLAKKL